MMVASFCFHQTHENYDVSAGPFFDQRFGESRNMQISVPK